MQPDDPRHGTYAGYQAHKKDGTEKCGPCTRAGRRYRAENHKDQARLASVEPVREHIKFLVENGMTIKGLAQRAGVSQATAHAALHGWRTQMLRDHADWILAVQPKLLPRGTLNRVGVTRRVQALQYMGWSLLQISSEARRLGYSLSLGTITGTEQRAARSEEKTYRAVVAVYAALSMRVPPPSKSASGTRVRARAAGYLSPMAWDPETIDDPLARPTGAALWRDKLPETSIDWVVVQRRLDGHKTRHLTHAETQELIKRGHARGLTEREMGVNGHRYKDAS